MKNTKTSIFVLFFMIISHFCMAQQTAESVIRNLEEAQKTAILKGDTIMLAKLFSKQVLVHNPQNNVTGFEGVMARIRMGQIDYSTFEVEIEKISFVENIAIVMGKETITPKGIAPNTGKTVTRIYTNIWLKSAETYQLIARQATIISVK